MRIINVWCAGVSDALSDYPRKDAKINGHDKYIFRAFLAALHLNKQDRITLFRGKTLLLLAKAKGLQESMQLSEYYLFVGIRTHVAIRMNRVNRSWQYNKATWSLFLLPFCKAIAPHTGQSSQLVVDDNDRNAQLLPAVARIALVLVPQVERLT